MAIRIVLAEDEAIIRLDLRESLQEEGYEVVGDVGRGDKAVEMVDALRPDVAIFDIKMPGMSGLEAAKIVSDKKICPVVMLTAFSQRELVERASEAGAMAYLVKPFTPNDLLPAVEIALSRGAQLKALEAEVLDLKERFEARKLIDRAKGILNEKMGLTEPEAFRWIQKASMDRRLSMQEVASAVIDQLGEKTSKS